MYQNLRGLNDQYENHFSSFRLKLQLLWVAFPVCTCFKCRLQPASLSEHRPTEAQVAIGGLYMKFSGDWGKEEASVTER